MIGIQTVSSPVEVFYQITILIIVAGFAIYDYKYKIVPDKFLLLLIPIVLFAAPIATFSMFNLGMAFSDSIFGFVAGGLITLMAAVITSGGIGGGDIKLCAILGFVYGIYGILFILIVSCITCIVAMLLSRREKEESMAFVPFIFIACVVYAIISIS